MKKYLMFVLAAALLASCSDDEKLPVDDGNGGDDGTTEETVFEEHDGYFVYHGETYKTVKLANGTTWMAEPLRYVPEGYTPSSDATEESHIWYPYELIVNEGSDNIRADGMKVLTDEASIKKLGYFYDTYAAFGGKEVTAENCYEFEGTQGICPEGWHIPTRMELVALCGRSTWGVNDELASPGNLIDATAIFYDTQYQAGKMEKYNDAGWNYVLSGARIKSSFTATPAYQNITFYTGNTTAEMLEKYKGQPTMNYMMSSTCYRPNYSTADPTVMTNLQFFAQMTTFTKTYPEGRITLAYSHYESGLQLRCVKDQN